jgi:hypothetical protein
MPEYSVENSASMHPRLAELVEYVQQQRREVLAAVDSVPGSLCDQRGESAWSVAEVLEHLHRVERGIVRLVSRGIERAKAAGLGPESETGSLLGSLDSYRLTFPSPAMVAPEPVMPRGELNTSQALVALADSRRSLLRAVAEGSGLALGTITYPHPLLGPLDLYQWILFVGNTRLVTQRRSASWGA